jgi:hypothetical protein
MAEMEVYYERERVERELKAESRELKRMNKEDARSRFAQEYATETALVEKSLELAKEKTMMLNAARKEEAVKRVRCPEKQARIVCASLAIDDMAFHYIDDPPRAICMISCTDAHTYTHPYSCQVEEQMARQRSERIEERRRKAQEIVDKINAEVLVLTGEANGGYHVPEDSTDLLAIIAVSHNIMDDLLECRQQSVEAMKRQMLVETKYNTFKNQIESLEVDMQRLRRAARLIEINPALVGTEEAAAAEVADLKRSLANKEEVCASICHALMHM